jgi:hypothetical protein
MGSTSLIPEINPKDLQTKKTIPDTVVHEKMIPKVKRM